MCPEPVEGHRNSGFDKRRPELVEGLSPKISVRGLP
jgi:hypothetical protein